MTGTRAIDTDPFSAQLRRRGVDPENQTVAITRFDDSQQEADLSEPTNCGGLGRIRHFRRTTAPGWPLNPLPIDPALRFLGRDTGDELRAQVFQNAVCNWRCWYCYVDFALLSANPQHSELVRSDELIARFASLEQRPSIIDLTGGQPDLVPEWIVWMLEAVERRGLSSSVYLWSDDNLSTDYYFSRLDRTQRARLDGAANYGKVCCFKGFDEMSFAFNTNADPALFARQFALMSRLLDETQLDLYAYATFTSLSDAGLPAAMNNFVDELQTIDRNLPLRTVPLQIAEFTPTRSRMTDDHDRALAIQEDAIAAWHAELKSRFTPEERDVGICDVPSRVR